ncbi:tetratricopeptide repeat protein, partial [Klebsiella pneumoniae]|uniref:tetratricopeptide repeat protein n=1 Tax=Klebsiella pneumoniae TaxID=573 RepID=UPI003013053C
PADTKLGMDVVRFLNAYKSPAAARAELEARVKAGGDNIDYKLALAELDFLGGRQGDAIGALQKLASETEQADRKLMVQGKLLEMLVAKGDKTA